MVTAKICATFILYIFLINNECSNYELSCPSFVNRKAVANQSCSVDGYYHCLEMYPTSEYQQGCRLPKRIDKGKYPIFDGASKYISGIDCPPDRYQPQPSFSYEINKCIYVKSLCTEEGQVIYSNGSTTEDRSCRCDYTKGYNFVNKPKEKCNCIPSVEDCTCYKQQCPNKFQILSPDYECIISVNSAVFNCPKIESINGQEINHTKQATDDLSQIPGHRPVRDLSSLPTFITLMVMVLLILLLPLYGILIINKWYKMFLVQRFEKDLEDRTCNEGDSVTFSCEVTNKTAKVEWYKDGLRLQQSRNHMIQSHDGIHTFTIIQTSDMCRGDYFVRTRGKESHPAKLEFRDVKLKVEEMETKLSEVIPANIQDVKLKVEEIETTVSEVIPANIQNVKLKVEEMETKVSEVIPSNIQDKNDESLDLTTNKSVVSLVDINTMEEKSGDRNNSTNKDESEKQQLAMGGTRPIDSPETATTENRQTGGTVHLHTQPESDQGHGEGVSEKGSNQDINDAVILCALEDNRTVKEFIEHIDCLKGEIGISDLRLVTHREVMAPGTTFRMFEQLFETNRFIFIFVTKNLSGIESFVGDALLQESLINQNRFSRVIPVSVDGPKYMPFSLASLIPINYDHYKQSIKEGKEDKIYVKMLARLFKMGRKQDLPI